MDISKIQFWQLSQSKDIEKSFEDLDVNNDGVINEQDAAAAASNKALAAEITNLLNTTDADENVEILGDFVDDISNAKNLSKAGSTSSVSEVNEVRTTDSVNKVNSTFQTTTTSGTKTLKSMDEYMKMMDEKYADLFSKLESMSFQEAQKWLSSTVDGTRYAGTTAITRSNAAEFFDADGDGRVTVIDQMLWQNYTEKYKNNYSGSKPVGQTGMGAGLYCISGRINSAVLSNVYGTTYDLDDLEQINYLKETSCYSDKLNPALTAQIKLNITKIAQDENWESRLDNLSSQKWFQTKFGKKYADQLKERINEAREYIKNNPENAKFAGIAAAFNVYKNNIEYENKINDAFGTYNMTTEDKQKIADEFGISTCQVQNMFDGEKVQREFMNTVKYACDINGDGIFDQKDLNELCEELDLDGDGCISDEEKNFLKILKAQMYAQATINHINVADDIDDVINYCEFKNNNSVAAELANDYRGAASDLAEKLDVNLSEYTNDEGLYITGSKPPEGKKSWDNGNAGRSLFGKYGWYWETTGSFAKYGVTTSKGVVDNYTPTHNLQWRVENCNLSKEELQTILEKINAASSAVKSQLAEVKKVVETKLANME